MADSIKSVELHYGSVALCEKILAALKAEGVDVEHLTSEILIPLDQIHTRGWGSTVEHVQMIDFTSAMRVLDVSCGISGPVRYIASKFGCHVTGIDLTEEFCRAATMLTQRCDLSDRVNFVRGDVLGLPFGDGSFAIVWCQNVTMNIEDRARLYGEVHRVLRPDGRFTFTEYTAGPAGDPIYPPPWARDPSISFLVSRDEMLATLEWAGFRIITLGDDSKVVDKGSQPTRTGPLGGWLVLGEDYPERVANARKSFAENRLAYVKLVAERID